MKKEYISPEMECIDIRMTHTLLTGSNPRMYNEEVSDGDGFVIG